MTPKLAKKTPEDPLKLLLWAVILLAMALATAILSGFDVRIAQDLLF